MKNNIMEFVRYNASAQRKAKARYRLLFILTTLIAIGEGIFIATH